jgi:glucosamine-6-phosphate deaminase
VEVIITANYDELSRSAANYVSRQIRNKPGTVLGLATGSTPVGTYRELVRLHREERLDFSRVVTFNLDEYVGLEPSHPQSYRYFMDQHLFNHVNIPKWNIYVPNGRAQQIEEYCQWYENQIRLHGGIGLQILGIGSEGHIGFNEPGSSLASRTRLKTLTEQTVKDNARFFGAAAQVPRFAITMGVGTILEAREIILLASGANKAEIIAAAVEGPVTAQVTASALQMHARVTVMVDEPAAAHFKRADYYRWAFEQKSRLAMQLSGRTL